MNKTDVKTIFRNYLVLLQDSKEQKNHIVDYFKSKGVRTCTYNMQSADYSFMIFENHLTGSKPLFFNDKFLIERKSGNHEEGGGFMEMRGNLTTGHKQFKDEFIRMQNVKDVFLLIENAENNKSIYKVPSFKQDNARYVKSFGSFIKNRNQDRENDIQIVYSPIEKSGENVMKLIADYLTKNL